MPRIIDGLRISADYVRIKKDKEISSALNTSNIFEFEDQFQDRVTREALTPEDAALGYTAGEVVALDISLVNIAKSTVDAYDFQVDYSFSVGRFGQFDAFAVATLTNDIESQILPTSPTVDRVGFADGPLRWRANFGVTWQHDDWRVGWSTQYFDSYRIYSSTASDADIERLVLRQGASEISSQTYHDLYVRYTFDKALDGVELQLGIQNLFDASPPIVATSSDTGGYSFYGDPRLRRYTLEFKMGF